MQKASQFVIDIRTKKQLRSELPPVAEQDGKFMAYVDALRVHPIHGYPWLVCHACNGTGRSNGHLCFECTNASGAVHVSQARPIPLKVKNKKRGKYKKRSAA